MRKLDFADLANWCRDNGYELDDWRPSLATTARRIDLAIPNDAQALSEFIDDLINIEQTEAERLLWIRDWTMWNERSQEIGLEHLRLLVDKMDVGMQQKPGHIYGIRQVEWREAVALLTVPVLYGWDAHLFFQSGVALVDISHESRISVSLPSGSKDAATRLVAWQDSA